MMRLGTHLECVGSLSRVLGAYQDGAREFIEKRLRLARRLSRLAKRLTRVGKVLKWICIEKIPRNTSGDCRRKTVRLAKGNARGYRIARVRS
ncbi:hypothetical protein B296_00037298 [Ensete ventricosum]|uniref:Uncharacterized protein n=1 Tax=Ensete ventricosum TaxID=4639 RepID=A0A426YC11_ENSVE|nr:hypothetical protein B296_00037298 [Ensete ventricosum]